MDSPNARPASWLAWAALLLVCGAAVAGAFVLWLRSRQRVELPELYRVPAFSLTGTDGRPVTDADLRGHVWVVDFVFTRCPSICPTLGSRMFELQEKLPADVKLVSITVDPDYDTPQVLKAHSEQHYKAQAGRWFWLTGGKAVIYELLQKGFKVGAPEEMKEGDIPHTPYMLLVDARGQVRGTYQGTDREAFGRLLGDALTLYVPPVVKRLPTANAALNSASALLLLVGFLFVKGRRVTAHKVCMVSACASSALFLASYLTYHHFVGSTPFTGVGWIRPVYFAILVSHTVLAALIVPLVLVTLLNAMRARFDRHRAIARWTLPIWLYVSVTGVAVYGMLYGI